MFLQLAVVQKCLSAQVAHERLRGPVKEHVYLQLVVLNETLPTDCTLERFFTSVNANVSVEVVLEGEARTTCLTCERLPFVDRLVRPQRFPLHKSLAALGAFERVFSSMNTLMALEGEGIPETLTAL